MSLKYEVQCKPLYSAYCRHGERHSDDGRPSMVWIDGDMYWHKYGKHHRDDGPAIQRITGQKSWWIRGDLMPSRRVYESKIRNEKNS